MTSLIGTTLNEMAYIFTVEAMSGGYSTGTVSITVSGDLTQDFALDADLLECLAPGYVYQTPSFSQDFETWPLDGWSIVSNAAGGLVRDSSDVYFDATYTGGTGMAADVNSDRNQYVDYDTELISPVIDAATLENLNLVYKANFQVYSGREALDLDISNDGGTSWTNILSWAENHGALYGLVGEMVSAPAPLYDRVPRGVGARPSRARVRHGEDGHPQDIPVRAQRWLPCV